MQPTVLHLFKGFFKIKSYTRRDTKHAIAGTGGANLPEPPHFDSIRKKHEVLSQLRKKELRHLIFPRTGNVSEYHGTGLIPVGQKYLADAQT